MLLDSIGLDYGIWIDLNFILFWVLKEFNCYFNYDMFFYSLFDWIWDPIYGPQRKHYWYVEFDEEYWIENFLSNLVMIPRILRWCSYAFPLFLVLRPLCLNFIFCKILFIEMSFVLWNPHQFLKPLYWFCLL